MSCKVKIIKNSKEGGERNFFLINLDFASLQAKICSCDTALNDEGIDKILYEVYKKGSKVSDLHSMTGFNTFCGSVGMKAIRVHDDVDNKDYVFIDDSNVKVLRNGSEIVIKAKDLNIDDHIIEHL